MKISWLLHLHQPPTQLPFVIHEISNSCYRPLIALLNNNSHLKMTFSISGSLIEWWQKENLGDIIDGIKYLVTRGQIELVGTAFYHPILTLLPESEALRQIRLEEDILSETFGVEIRGQKAENVLTPHTSDRLLRGFFSPELAISDKLLNLLSRLGYQYAVADEVAAVGEPHYLSVMGQLTKVTIRDRGASLAVAFGFVQNQNSFENMTDSYSRFTDSLLLVMDGETFGHHWPGSLAFLKDLVAFGHEEYLTVSEMVANKQSFPVETISESTWGTSDEDLHRGVLYPKWNLSDNSVHQLQWQLTKLAIAAVGGKDYHGFESQINTDSLKKDGETAIRENSPKGPLIGAARKSVEIPSIGRADDNTARSLLDSALHSDQYWWASHNPFWNIDMVKRGADLLLAAVMSSSAQDMVKTEAHDLYNSILSEAKRLYGEEVVTG